MLVRQENETKRSVPVATKSCDVDRSEHSMQRLQVLQRRGDQLRALHILAVGVTMILCFLVVSNHYFSGLVLPDVGAGYRVDLNRADAVEISVIPSIGPQMARRIIDSRKLNGKFESFSQLRGVRGIGPKTLETIKRHAVLGQ